MDPKAMDADVEEPTDKARGCSRMSADVLHDFPPRQPRVTTNGGQREGLHIALVLIAAAALVALYAVQCTLGRLLQPTYVAVAEMPRYTGDDAHEQNPDWLRMQQHAEDRVAGNWTCACTHKRALQAQLAFSPDFPCELIVQACFNESSPWRAATFALNHTIHRVFPAEYSEDFCGSDELVRNNAAADLQAMLQFCWHLRTFNDLQMPSFDAMPSMNDMYEAALAALGRAMQSAEKSVIAAAGLNGSLLPAASYPPGDGLHSKLYLLHFRLMLLRSVLFRIAVSQGPAAAGLMSKDGLDVITIEHSNSSILAYPMFSGLYPGKFYLYAKTAGSRLQEDHARARLMTTFWDWSSDSYMVEQPYSLASPGNITIDTSSDGFNKPLDWCFQHYMLLTDVCMPAACTKVLPKRMLVIVIEALAFAGSLIALLFLGFLPLLWNWGIMPLSNTGKES